MFELAQRLRARGHEPRTSGCRSASSTLEEHGYTATRHQREVGAGYFDGVRERGQRRRELDACAHRLDRGGAVPKLNGGHGPARWSGGGVPGGSRGPHPGGARIRRELHRELRRRGGSAADRAAGRHDDGAPRRASCPRPMSIREDDWQVAPAPADLRRPPRRDHRPGRPQDDDQRAQLGRPGLHGRLRGRVLADLGEHRRRAAQPARRRARNDLARHRRTARATGSNDETATLVVRPRGWHLLERHVAGRRRARSRRACSTSGCTCFHNARELLDARHRAVLLPARSSRATSRRACGTRSSCSPRTSSDIPRGTIRATVLIETILAAFEMDEILYELREHSAGLNAGRWDYIFSVDQEARADASAARPRAGHDDRAVHARVHASCSSHVPPARRARDRRHGRVHPVAPRRRGQRASRSAKVREDKEREAATASTGRGSRIPTSSRSRRGVRRASWASGRTRSSGCATDVESTAERTARLRGRRGRGHRRRVCARTSRSACATSTRGCAASGAAAIDNLMEDVATAEISRSQVWSGCTRATSPRNAFARRSAASRPAPRPRRTCSRKSHWPPEFVEFLTLPAYDRLA